MKRLKNIIIISFIAFYGCSNSPEYSIKRNFKSLVNNKNCQVEFYYPKIETKKSNLRLSELNEILEKYADCEYYMHNCNETSNEKRIIKGDYNITLQTEDILSIEFVTKIISFGEKNVKTVFHSLVINPKKINDKDYSLFQPDPELLFPRFDREILKKYVENYNKTNFQTVNLLAYEKGSKYAITWGLTKDKFILYVGGEGEWFGDGKIEIPMKEIKNNR